MDYSRRALAILTNSRLFQNYLKFTNTLAYSVRHEMARVSRWLKVGSFFQSLMIEVFKHNFLPT